jgi:hypothetical protein
MPADRPALGEVWRTSNDAGAVSRACVVAIDSERDILLLASQVGRCAPMAIRSLLLTWAFESASVSVQSLCQAQGCHEVAFVRARLATEGLRHVCHRHIPANTGIIFPGDPESALPNVPVAAVAREEIPEIALSECPACHSQTSLGPRACCHCGARWRALAQSAPMDRLASFVADARRLLRREGRDASYVLMPDSVGRIVVMDTNAVPLRNADDEEILISRGAGRGSGPVFAGLPVQYTVDGPVIIVSVAERPADPEGPRFVRSRDMVGYVHTTTNPDGGYVLERMGHIVGSSRITVPAERFMEIFQPLDAAAPPVGSFWRNPDVDGSFITVTGHSQAPGAVMHVNFANEVSAYDALPLRAFTQRFVRFDQMEQPKIGSRWASRASLDPVVVTEINTIEGMTYVVVRNFAGNIFRVLLPDLWRNYSDITPEGELLCEMNDEWSDLAGVTYRVVHLDRDLCIATLTTPDGTRVQHNPKSMKGWTKIERRDVYDRLAGEDLFGMGD